MNPSNNSTTNFNKNKPQHGYYQEVLDIARVSKVTKGGRRFHTRAVVVLGDGKGLVGLGVSSAKGSDANHAISKASNVAKKQMCKMVIIKPATIPHEIKAKVAGANILLKPAKEGTGLIVGGVARQILEVAGYHNVYSKSLGNKNKMNLAYATILALKKLVDPKHWHLSNLKTVDQKDKGNNQ